MQRRKDNIEYLELTEHELAQYRQHGRKSLCIRVIFFFLLIPIYIIYCIEIFSKFPVPLVWCLITLLVYVTAFIGGWVFRFAGTPRGIRHGKVSKKIPVGGKYRGYRFNIYFEDIHKSITNKIIQPTKAHPVIMRGDSVMVVKSYMGARYIMLCDGCK